MRALTRVDDVLRVDAGARDDDAADGFLRPLHERGDAKRVADLHVRHLLDVDRHAVGGADDDLLDVVDRRDQPDAAHDQPGAVRLEHVAADIEVAVADGRHHRAERQVVGPQAIRIDVDLVLLHVAADRRDFRDARNGVELVADEPVLQRAQFAQRMRRTLDRVPEHVADAGRVRAERRRDARGQALRDEAHALEHASPREVQIHVVLEDDVDHREAERRLRADDAHAGQPLQVRRQRVGDLVLDLLRAVPGPVREDDDLVVGEIRNRVDRRGRQRPPAPAGEAEVQNDDDEPVLQCNVNESIDHARLAEAPPRSVSEGGSHDTRHAARVHARTYAPGRRVRADTRRL